MDHQRSKPEPTIVSEGDSTSCSCGALGPLLVGLLEAGEVVSAGIFEEIAEGLHERLQTGCGRAFALLLTARGRRHGANFVDDLGQRGHLRTVKGVGPKGVDRHADLAWTKHESEARRATYLFWGGRTKAT